MIVFYPNGEKTPLNNYNDYHIRHTADGFDELHFSVPTSDPQYPLLLEEMPVEAAGNNWLIKKIYDDDIACELNLDELKATGTRAFDSGSVTLQALLSSVLPNGWTATGAAQSTIRRTIRMDFATPLDILSAAMEIYGVCMQFDVPNRSITVIVPSLQPVSGEYITDELNLRKLSYQGETSDFCTRLYAYGADGLSVSDAIVNGSRYGLPYVDNHEYSDKIIVGYWEDSRYTDAESLYDDAVTRLAELARPVQSYECDAIDLAKESDEYSFLAFRVHRKITLIDRKRSLRVVHQIVEYDEYPEEPSRSVVTLSSTAPTVTSVMRSQIETVEREAQNTAVSEITRATELLTGAQGGYIVFRYDDDKKPYEMLIMDAENEADAVHVWRYNKNGWGYSANGVDGNYTLAATIDGGIIADFIKTGTIDASQVDVTNLDADNINAGTLTADRLSLLGYFTANNGFVIDENGKMTANGATINGSLSANGTYFIVTVEEGTINVKSLSSNATVVRITGGRLFDGQTGQYIGDDGDIRLTETVNGALTRIRPTSLQQVSQESNACVSITTTHYSNNTENGEIEVRKYDSNGDVEGYLRLQDDIMLYDSGLSGAGQSVTQIERDGALFGGVGSAYTPGLFDVQYPAKFPDATITGVLDVTQRRCYANLSSAGWYRIFEYDSVSSAAVQGDYAFSIDVTIVEWTRQIHKITLFGVYGALKFADETSVSSLTYFDKIRYVQNGSKGYIDVHYASTAGSRVEAIYFDVKCSIIDYVGRFKSLTPTAVADATSGETVLTTHEFVPNNCKTTISKTYVPQSYVTETAFNRINAVLSGDVLIVNLNLQISSLPTGSGFVTIGKINLPKGLYDNYSILQSVPIQSSQYNIVVYIQVDGTIQLYNGNSATISGWARANLVSFI